MVASSLLKLHAVSARCLAWALVLVVLPGAFSGCRGGEEALDPSLTAEAVAPDEYESDLRLRVTRDLEAASQDQSAERARVSFERPYFYKEYATYPEGVENFQLDFTERESRTAPLTADMTVDKVRFATRFRTKKEEARDDTEFLRDTGYQKVSYEMRNGRWYRTGSLFVAATTEEMIDGAWQPILESPVRPVLEVEEPESFWQKLKFWQ